MRVAAYQAPLLAAGSMDALGLIRTRVEWCEAEGVKILCCPEAILGGLADYSGNPTRFAIAADPGRLDSALAAHGATALFVPTNNGLPPPRARAELVAQARNVDIARAVENSMWVIRADVAGRTDELVSYGSSGIVDPDGMVVQAARQMSDDLLVAEIDTTPRAQRHGWDASRNRAVMNEYATYVAASVTAARPELVR